MSLPLHNVYLIHELANCLKIKCENESIQLNEIPESASRYAQAHRQYAFICFYFSINRTIINSDLAYVFHPLQFNLIEFNVCKFMHLAEVC